MSNLRYVFEIGFALSPKDNENMEEILKIYNFR